MYLTKEEIKIIDFIDKKSVTAFAIVADELSPVKKMPKDYKCTNTTLLRLMKEEKLRDIENFITMTSWFMKTKKILTKLEFEGYITIKENGLSENPFMLKDPNGEFINTYEFFYLARDYWNNLITKLPELEIFIKNGYMTDEELERENEKASRIKAENRTTFISVFAILAGLITTIVTIVFNFITYSTDRNVVIKNPTDTVFVKVLPEAADTSIILSSQANKGNHEQSN